MPSLPNVCACHASASLYMHMLVCQSMSSDVKGYPCCCIEKLYNKAIDTDALVLRFRGFASVFVRPLRVLDGVAVGRADVYREPIAQFCSIRAESS